MSIEKSSSSSCRFRTWVFMVMAISGSGFLMRLQGVMSDETENCLPCILFGTQAVLRDHCLTIV